MALRRRAATQLLELAWKGTESDRFRWLHEGVRRGYVHGVAPILERLLNKSMSGSAPIRVAVRNSASTSKSFNAFRSDLDVAIIFALGTADHSVMTAVTTYKRLRRILPFLGELECYSESEWASRDNLIRQFKPTILLLRDIRKLSWLERDLNRSGGSYHREKAKSAIERLFAQYGIAASQGALGRTAFRTILEKWADSLAGEDDPSSWGALPEVCHSQFLECSFGPRASGSDGLSLNERATAVLWSIVPDGVVQAQKNTAVRSHARAVAEYEWIVCQSVRRCTSGRDTTLEGWIRHLEDRVSILA